MKISLSLVLIFCINLIGFAQLNSVQFEEIEQLQQNEKRNIIVFIHTNWCKYCKVTHDKTFKNPEIIKLLNEKFYFIDFNAEDKRKIIFNNTVFNFKPSGNNVGIHELAVELGTIKKQINYPTLCILNDKNEIIFQYNSFLNAKDFLKILESQF